MPKPTGNTTSQSVRKAQEAAAAVQQFAHIKDPAIRKQMEELAAQDAAKAKARSQHDGTPVRFIFAEAPRGRVVGEVAAVLNTFGQREQGTITAELIPGELYEVKIYDDAPLLLVHEHHRGWYWQ